MERLKFIRKTKYILLILGVAVVSSLFWLSPAYAAPTITEYPGPTEGTPTGLVKDSNGNVWVSDWENNAIDEYAPDGSLTDTFTIPTLDSFSYPGPINGIALGPDGNIWFTESGADKIGKLTSSGTFTEYDVSASSHPVNITAGPDGKLWFTESSSGIIGKISTSGTVTEYSVTNAGAELTGITAGPDGNIWFTEFGADKVGKITTSGAFTEYSVPGSAPWQIAKGSDGNLWFTEIASNKIGKMTTAGTFTEYDIPSINCTPAGITAGPDGNLWFTEFSTSTIGMITTAGDITEYTTPTPDSEPANIAIGPNNSVWFTENHEDQVGVVLGLSIPAPPNQQSSNTSSSNPLAPDTGYGMPIRSNPSPIYSAIFITSGFVGLIFAAKHYKYKPKS